MNIQQLDKELKKIAVPPRVYSLTGRQDERLCIEPQGDRWVVFFVERGKERVLKQFLSESDACDFMLEELRFEV